MPDYLSSPPNSQAISTEQARYDDAQNAPFRMCRAIVKNNPLNIETIISQESVHKCRSQGKICVLDIDSQGVRQLKEVSNLSPVYVFVKPPSMSTLEERLRSRKTETEESLRKRLDAARQVCEAALNL